MKTVKRILRGNVNPITGDVDTHKATCSLMSHRNTPHQDSGLSPAELLYGCRIRDHLPDMFRSTKTKGTEDWSYAQRKKTLPKKEILDSQRILKPFKVGDSVSVQNQTGNRPRKWSSTGSIDEVMPHRQYKVMLDGSRHVTLRNRRFLRRIHATVRDRSQRSAHQQRFSSLRPRQHTLQMPQPALNTDKHNKVSLQLPEPQPTPPATPPATPIGPVTPLPQIDIVQESAPNTPHIEAAQPSTLINIPLADPPMESSTSPRRSNRARKRTKRLIEEL